MFYIKCLQESFFYIYIFNIVKHVTIPTYFFFYIVQMKPIPLSNVIGQLNKFSILP